MQSLQNENLVALNFTERFYDERRPLTGFNRGNEKQTKRKKETDFVCD